MDLLLRGIKMELIDHNFLIIDFTITAEVAKKHRCNSHC